MRCVPEWVGKNHDAKVPPRVRLRVFEHHSGICFLSGRKIRAGEQWDCDHAVALINGGEHRESNLVPVLRGPHRLKTAEDVAEKSRIYRKRANHLGIKTPKQKIASRGFPKRVRTHAGREPVKRSELFGN